MTDEAPEMDIEVTQEDIDRARAEGLTGAEMMARAIRRQFPNARNVTISPDGETITVDVGEPLD